MDAYQNQTLVNSNGDFVESQLREALTNEANDEKFILTPEERKEFERQKYDPDLL